MLEGVEGLLGHIVITVAVLEGQVELVLGAQLLKAVGHWTRLSAATAENVRVDVLLDAFG